MIHNYSPLHVFVLFCFMFLFAAASVRLQCVRHVFMLMPTADSTNRDEFRCTPEYNLRCFKQVSDSITGENMYGAPVDLSFKNICSLADAWKEEPSSIQRPLKRNSEMKYLSCSLRLSNNNISDLHELQKTVSHFLAKPSQLTWLDLSFNKISHIDQVLCELSELRVLYLHGNSIFILSEVDRLGMLPHLHTITLHGNIIETNKAYRNRVISALPRLKTMDFSAVTCQERVMAKIWHQNNSHNRSSKEALR